MQANFIAHVTKKDLQLVCKKAHGESVMSLGHSNTPEPLSKHWKLTQYIATLARFMHQYQDFQYDLNIIILFVTEHFLDDILL